MAGPRVFEAMRSQLVHFAAALLAAVSTVAGAQVPSTMPVPPALQTPGASTVALPLDRVVAVVGDVIITQSNV